MDLWWLGMWLRWTNGLNARIGRCWLERTAAKRRHWEERARVVLEEVTSEWRRGRLDEAYALSDCPETEAALWLADELSGDFDNLPLAWWPAVHEWVGDWLARADWRSYAMELLRTDRRA